MVFINIMAQVQLICLMSFYRKGPASFEQQKLIEEISEYWADFLVKVLDKALSEIEIDYILYRKCRANQIAVPGR